MIKAVIFDCFGVIITDALKVVLDEVGARDKGKARQIMDIIHTNNRGLIDPAESNRRIAEILDISVEEWRKRIDSGEAKDEKLMAYIKDLRSGYKTALLSNIGRQSLSRRFTQSELEEHFDCVITSGELGIMKPDPDIYLHAAEQLGVDPQKCIMIDDRETHCAGAISAGMQAIQYNDFGLMKRELEGMLHAKV